MESEAERRKVRLSYFLVVVAVPAAWAAESLVRIFFFAERTAIFREWLGPSLRRIAWISVGLTVVLGLVSVAMRPALRRRYAPAAAMMAGASIPQVPAILACAVGLLGADPLPVALCALACTAFVAWHRPAPAP